jgi:hypothetical protein
LLLYTSAFSPDGERHAIISFSYDIAASCAAVIISHYFADIIIITFISLRHYFHYFQLSLILSLAIDIDSILICQLIAATKTLSRVDTAPAASCRH